MVRDAWYTEKWEDKFLLWFKATGWRPKDVQIRFPVIKRNLNTSGKYSPNYNWKWKVIGSLHFMVLITILVYFLFCFSNFTPEFQLNFGILIFATVFGFTSLMDYYNWAPNFEIFRGIAFLILFYLVQGEIILQTNFWLFNFLVTYFIFTIGVGIWAKYNISNRKLALTK